MDDHRSDAQSRPDHPENPPPQAPLKVLLLITSTAGGVGLHAFYLAKLLPKSDFDLTVGFGPGYPLDKDIAGLDVPVVHLSLSRKISPLTNLRGFFQLLGLLRRERFDILCMECSIAGLLGRVAGWLTRVPIRVFVIQLHASHTQQSRLKQWVYRAVEKFADPLTTHYVAVSHAIKEFGVRQGTMKAKNIDVIYNGITLPDPGRYDRSQVRQALGLQPDSLVVGSLARLEPQKGLTYLVQAASIVLRKIPHVQFMVAGEGPLQAQLEAQAKALNIQEQFKFVGWQSDVQRALSAMDVFCLPSLWESFGIALAEAMAMRVPIVASGIDGIPEVVEDGQTGILVPPKDPQALADALTTLLLDHSLRRRMGEAGRKRVEAKFTVDEMVDRYSDLFKRLQEHRTPLRHRSS